MPIITPSNEDYLEAILAVQSNGVSRSVDVAKHLSVSKPAVAIATNNLIEKGLITKESYGDILLTKLGNQIAIETQEKHTAIKTWLLSIGVSEATADLECCKLEHLLSKETLDCIKKTVK